MADLSDQSQSGALETPADAGKGREGIVRRWQMAIDLASKHERDWRERARNVVRRYRQEGDEQADADPYSTQQRGKRFNILWSNTEVMRPALYNSTPRPDVRRRYRDEDELGKQAATVLERALSYSIDAYDFDHTMELAVLDQLLPGRAVTRVRYKPTIETQQPDPYPAEPVDENEYGEAVYRPEDMDEAGQPRMVEPEPYDAVTYQEVVCEHVAWEDFRRGPGQTWDEVDWIAFRHTPTRRQLKDDLGIDPRVANKVPLEYEPSEEYKGAAEEEPELFKRAVVWEIWNKEDKKVVFVAEGMKDRPLKEQDDPLGLTGFFPIPRPLYALQTSDSLVPVELFRLYKDQADELDRITGRINKLVSGLKVRGIYDSTIQQMDTLMQSGDNTMLPAGEQALTMMQQGGSLDKAIWMMPIEMLARVLVQLYTQREQIKQTIYEITGLSDILRGSTNPNETASAQQLKAQTGSQRLKRMQREIQRYARDLMRIKAEVMAEHFEPEMLEQMTQMQVGPEVQELLRSDLSRMFRIDIETDSTIAAEQMQDQEAVVNLLDGVTRYVSAVGPVVQSGYMPAKAAVALLEDVVRRFKFGRKVEDALDEAQQQAEQAEQQGQGQERPDPEMQQVQAEIERKNAEMQAEQQRRQAEMQAEQERQNRQLEAEMQRKERELEQTLELKRQEMQERLEIEREKARNQAEVAQMKAQQQSREKAA